MVSSNIFRFVFCVTICLLFFVNVTGRDMQDDNAPDSSIIINPTDRSPEFIIPCGPDRTAYHETNEIASSVNDNGTWGALIGSSTSPSHAFETPRNSNVEYLFGGAIWIGGIIGEDTLVSVGADGWSYSATGEIRPNDGASMIEADLFSGQTWQSIANDTTTEGISNDYFGRPHLPLNVEIVVRSHSWDIPEFEDILIYDLIVANIGDQTITQGWIGLYFDCDIKIDEVEPFGHRDDISGTIPGTSIVYSIDSDGNLSSEGEPYDRIFAFKSLASSIPTPHTNFNWWIGNGNPAFDFGPRMRGTLDNPYRDFMTGGLGTPEGDLNKYYILSHPEWDYDQVFTASIGPDDPIWMNPNPELAQDFTDGYDTRFLFSIGPFDLAAGESQRLLFTTFTGADVHTEPNNIDNLWQDPTAYLDGLDFSDVLANSDAADDFAAVILDPLLPILGFELTQNNSSSAVIKWAPWVFDNVTEYAIYLTEIDPASLPHTDVLPIWISPDPSDEYARVTAPQTNFEFTSLDPAKIYTVAVANVTSTEIGAMSDPIVFNLGGRPSAPTIVEEFIFSRAGEPAQFTIEPPAGVEVDYYKIYRFDDSVMAEQRYLPFYDRGCASDYIDQVEIINDPASGTDYYYYAIEPYDQLSGRTSIYTESVPVEDSWFVVTAVDVNGFETEFSNPVPVNIIEPVSRDVLLITDYRFTPEPSYIDSIINFYDFVLMGIDYDIYHYIDSIYYSDCPTNDFYCMDWHDFMRYRMIIIDDGILDRIFNAEYESTLRGFERYVHSGGTLAYSGAFIDFLGFSSSTPPLLYEIDNPQIQALFDISAIYYAGHRYCGAYSCSDEITGLSRVVGNSGWTSLDYDIENYKFRTRLLMFWPPTSPPNVASFVPGESATVTHIAQTLYPDVSMIENQPIGIHTVVGPGQTYLFGFHLWYMDRFQARRLIFQLLGEEHFFVGEVTIDPDTINWIDANRIEPIDVDIYLIDMQEGTSLSELNLSSLDVNTDIIPSSCEFIPFNPYFSGAVVKITMPIADLILSYDPWWDEEIKFVKITGRTQDQTSIHAIGEFLGRGRISGDLNGDGVVDITDIIIMVDYQFLGGPAPVMMEAADVDGNCQFDISDLIVMVNFLFDNGPPPHCGCSE